MIRRRDPGLWTYFFGSKCITNDIYQSIMGGPKPRSFAMLIHYTLQSIYARSAPFSHLLRSIAKSRLSLDCFFGPHRHVKGETPIPVFALSTPFAHSLRSIAKSRLSLDARVLPSIDLYHIVIMHI